MVQTIDDVFPMGIKPPEGRQKFTIDRISGFSLGKPATKFKKQFEVEPHHEKTNKGVVFNVETVPEPIKNHRHMKKCKIEDLLEDFEGSLEVMSQMPENLVYNGKHGFLAACVTAFANHLPLSLDPNDFWTLITFSLSKHVTKNAEELRSKFVEHKGKKELVVEVDHFKMNHGNEKGDGSPAEEWERCVFPGFSNQIKTHIGDEAYDTIIGDFSTTTATSKAASEIALMSTMQKYFSYTMLTRCGIPKIELRGTREDWVNLRSKTEALQKYMTKDFAKPWMKVLLPILDEFVNSYDGNINYTFWQTMVKFRETKRGSGYHEYISGWIQNFYPYISKREDVCIVEYMAPWENCYFSGPKPKEFPPVQTSAPVKWKYYGVVFPLQFRAGFNGYCQDPETGALSPSIGWSVVHRPAKVGDD